ncbi:hypothetical protein [Janthinobacterium aquaticum]|uniref:hypothetical protein n=1 Tax=Janthinobacterium sp. FT58W TaxID=2654254 RepID=UPI00126494BF|nr:hypothetical protein [Janthinobacterium sp. FT58W]KAB8042442.1 hypothetical protein GCM43_12955 [Janthinobacterium sp. FT58W]
MTQRNRLPSFKRMAPKAACAGANTSGEGAISLRQISKAQGLCQWQEAGGGFADLAQKAKDGLVNNGLHHGAAHLSQR